MSHKTNTLPNVSHHTKCSTVCFSRLVLQLMHTISSPVVNRTINGYCIKLLNSQTSQILSYMQQEYDILINITLPMTQEAMHAALS